MEDTLSKFISESTKRHEENSNLIKEIRATTDAAIRNQGASIKTLEIQIGQISKVLQEIGFGSLPSSTETNPRDQVKSISTTIEADSHSICRASVSVMPLSTYLNLGLGELAHTRLTVELADRTVKYPKGIVENILVEIGKFTFLVDFIILDMPEDIKVPLILRSPFLSTAHAKIDVYKRKETLRVGGREDYFQKSLDPFLEDYIKLNDLNEPFELRRNQGDDLMPTIKEGDVIEEFRTRDEDLDIGIDDYPSYCDDDKKIHIDCAHNLKFSCMIGFECTHVKFYPLLYINVMSRKFYNSIMQNKMVYKGDNVVVTLMNVPIFVGTFSVMTDFLVLEDMDAYHDEGMGDVIFGEPFLREVGIKAKCFEGIITLYNGDDEVTYQMVRSHPRFKNHTNEQCNKIPPLLKGADEEISDGGSPRVIVYEYDGLPIQPVAPPSPDYIPGLEDPQTPPVPQDEDEREPMFVQAHDLDYVPEPVYPEYIPLEDEHVFPAEEQPLPPVDSPTAESLGYITDSDPEEDPEEYEDDETEDGPVDYPMDGGDDGDDDDDDSSGDDVNDEDEDDDDDEEEEEHLAPPDSAIVVPTVEPISPPEGTEPVIPPPSTDISTTGARITVRL
ncbi:putative reverse transcriptase domain-containing protein [Tanacetum coccineum]